MDSDQIRRIVEAALLASDGPLTVANLTRLFQPGELEAQQETQLIRDALKALEEDAAGRGVELKRVASGYRYQVRKETAVWVSRLWDEKPPRYTRALLETLALIAYQQPVTRGDIEQVRGVSVSQNIMRTLLEREWIRVLGQKEVPGRPSLYGTTKTFLDYFNLKSLDQLPPLPEIQALIEPALALSEETQGAPQDQPAHREMSAAEQPAHTADAPEVSELQSDDEGATAAATAITEDREGAEETDEAGSSADAAIVHSVTAHVEMPDDVPEDNPPAGSAEVVRLHTQPKN